MMGILLLCYYCATNAYTLSDYEGLNGSHSAETHSCFLYFFFFYRRNSIEITKKKKVIRTYHDVVYNAHVTRIMPHSNEV